MVDYRHYVFASDGRLASSLPFPCESEQEAVAFESWLAREFEVRQVWSGLHRVIGFGARQ